MSGVILFSRAEEAYSRGDSDQAFGLYQQGIKKILKNEDVTAFIPAIVPPDFPRETLGALWRNFCGFFKDPALPFNRQNSPDAFKLLSSFRPSADKPHPQFSKKPRGKVILAGMQVTAGLTLGLLAWDEGDRATAAKRYKEALDLAEVHPEFKVLTPATVGLERWVHNDLKDAESNLGHLIMNDTKNAAMLKILGEKEPKRRDVVELPYTRIEGDGTVRQTDGVQVATDVCAKCGRRQAKLSKCSRCKQASYCGAECQKAHWSSHKSSCRAPGA